MIKLELDTMSVDDNLIGAVATDAGIVIIDVVEESGPAGWSVISVSGTPGAVLTWLLAHYVVEGDESLTDALDMMRTAVAVDEVSEVAA